MGESIEIIVLVEIGAAAVASHLLDVGILSIAVIVIPVLIAKLMITDVWTVIERQVDDPPEAVRSRWVAAYRIG